MATAIALDESERKVLRQIRQWVGHNDKAYMFWFTYNNGVAISWEGGWELSINSHFRNQYTLYNGKVVKNWDE